MGGVRSWLADRLRRRRWGLLAALLTIPLGMAYTFVFTWRQNGMAYWSVPGDIWGTYRAAHWIGWGDLGGIYSAGSGLVTFPAILLPLAPVAMLTGALGLSESYARTLHHPGAWYVLGPYEILLSGVALVAADRLAERLGARPLRRFVLAVAGGIALANVDVVWGHPEDAMAVGLALWALDLALDGRWAGSGWLFGLALATQPLVVLALPVLLARAPWRRMPAYLGRTVLPAAVLLATPLIAQFHATYRSIVEQPNFPLIDHVTPWTHLAPSLGGTGRDVMVAAGPGRVVAVVLAVAVGVLCRRFRAQDATLVWAVAAALALRCLTESVMVPYYIWPALAAALVVGVARAPWPRVLGASSVACFATYFADSRPAGWILWWSVVTACLLLVLALSLPATLRGLRSRKDPEMPEIPAEKHSPLVVTALQ